jgi:hypothetical protein
LANLRFSGVERLKEPRALRWLVLASIAVMVKLIAGGSTIYWIIVGGFVALMLSILVNELFE